MANVLSFGDITSETVSGNLHVTNHMIEEGVLSLSVTSQWQGHKNFLEVGRAGIRERSPNLCTSKGATPSQERTSANEVYSSFIQLANSGAFFENTIL